MHKLKEFVKIYSLLVSILLPPTQHTYLKKCLRGYPEDITLKNTISSGCSILDMHAV